MFIFLIWLLLLNDCFAAPEALLVPRFASLRAKEVNVHVGPGTQYPIEWKLVKTSLPVEIIAEFDTWRKIRDWQGTEGWVHKSLLSGRRTVIVIGEIRNLYKKATTAAPIVARLQPGVVAKVLECDNTWCRIDANRYRGWIERKMIWGVYPQESKF
jgi:SH3-like domain-containing protein